MSGTPGPEVRRPHPLSQAGPGQLARFAAKDAYLMLGHSPKRAPPRKGIAVANRLATATSPYLLQHADNPVDWWEWGEEAFAEARRRDVPVLLSVGYAACHWCHVMAHESFADPEIGRLINSHFVAIKVDREERPDIDTLYQEALALQGEQGGWPLTMFLTPEGEAFWGGTYFPPEPRWGRPSFRQVLERIAALWRDSRDRIRKSAGALSEGLRQLETPTGGALDPDFVRAAAATIAEEFDPVHGGIGSAPKFPQAPVLDFLWLVARRDGKRLLERRVLHTLARMCQGGIYDHLGGGFARYAVDAFWLVPHFEKMLYDNAQLVALLAEAGAATGDPLYTRRLRETVGWLQREMMADAGLASSLDADSEGEEGRYYLWTLEQIEELLGADAEEFALAYGVTGRGNFEGRNVLNRLHEAGLRSPAEEERLARLREILLRARSARVPPARDDKVLADWNGLAIAALVEASRRLADPALLALARDLFERVVRHLAPNSRLFHSWRAGRPGVPGMLGDYAALARAALLLFEATGEPAYLARSRGWLEVAEELFADGSGCYRHARDDGALPIAARNARDGPTPSPLALLAEALLRLGLVTGERLWEERAVRLFSAYGGEARRQAFAHAGLLRSFLFATEPLQIVVVSRGDAQAGALSTAAGQSAPPGYVLFQIADGTALPSEHPAHGKAGRGGRSCAYVCLGRTCLEPVFDPDALSALLGQLAKSRPSAS